jgi:hypothetical protein
VQHDAFSASPVAYTSRRVIAAIPASARDASAFSTTSGLTNAIASSFCPHLRVCYCPDAESSFFLELCYRLGYGPPAMILISRTRSWGSEFNSDTGISRYLRRDRKKYDPRHCKEITCFWSLQNEAKQADKFGLWYLNPTSFGLQPITISCWTKKPNHH